MANQDSRRFCVQLTAEGSEDFDALERFEVYDHGGGDVVFASPEQEEAERISGKLNAWWNAHEERRGFRQVLAGGAMLVLAIASLGACAPLPAGPPPGDPATVCGILVGGTDGGGTYTPDEACAAILETIRTNPYCQDAGILGHAAGCPSTLGYGDGGHCQDAKYFCAVGIDRIREHIEATACNVSTVTIDLTCWGEK